MSIVSFQFSTIFMNKQLYINYEIYFSNLSLSLKFVVVTEEQKQNLWYLTRI